MATIGDLMARDLVSVEPTATIAEAARVLTEHRISSCLVMDGESTLGIFTERDIVRALAGQTDAGDHPVREWMTPEPTTVPSSTGIPESLQIMLDGGYRHLPVKEGGRIVGIVSMRDISRWLGSA